MSYNNGEPLFQREDGGEVVLEYDEKTQRTVDNAQSGLNCMKCIMFCNPCFCCMYAAFPQLKQAFSVPQNMGSVRGLPIGSTCLSEYEQSQILERWRGNWKIQPLSASKGGDCEDAFIDGNKVILTGGFHNKRQTVRSGMHGKHRKRITTAVANSPKEQILKLFRAPNGDIYVDNIGTKLVSESDGELVFDTAMFTKVMYQREWKRMGLSGPGVVPQAVSNDQPPTYYPPSAPLEPPPAYEAPPAYEELPKQNKMSYC